jgi:putative ABC transport system ATP-binding protein
MSEILKVVNVEKYYGNKGNLTKALDQVSFSMLKGEFTGIMGASGSGKTTLLNCISTIDSVTTGNIFIKGTDITGVKGGGLAKFRREELGFMFQDYNLLNTLTGFEKIILPPFHSGEDHHTAPIKHTSWQRGSISRIYSIDFPMRCREASARGWPPPGR